LLFRNLMISPTAEIQLLLYF